MAEVPRIITVDPTWTIARIVRGAMDLLDRSIIQVDVPRGTEALEELQRGGARLVITAWDLYDDMRGLELALRVKQTTPETAVIILADLDDPDDLDEETMSASPFIYMHRPVDIHQFLRVLISGINGESIFEAAHPVTLAEAAAPLLSDHGPLPALDLGAARGIVKRLLVDVGAMAIILAARTGELLLEDGAPGYLNREQLTQALLPMVNTTIEMSSLVGGQAQSLQLYDGDDKDVFVFSVGMHHFLCVVFDGQAGGRQFGVVNRYGRQAVQDLVALLGASAFKLDTRAVEPAPKPTRKRKTATTEAAPVEPEIVKPDIPVVEPEPVRLEPIQNLDMSIFDQLEQVDSSAAEDLFDLDKLADLVTKGSGREEVSFGEAMELGVLPNLDNPPKK